MDGWTRIALLWDWRPPVLLGCAALGLAYAWVTRFRWSKTALYFYLALFSLLLALISPIDALADNYLFSAHMVQHILLILCVAPLLIAGTPEALLRRVLRRPAIAKIEQVLRQPRVAWPLGVGTMWIWHWPRFYNAALAQDWIHGCEHISFLVTAMIFWWPIISPLPESRLSPLTAMVYVFAGCAAHTILAIVLTFAPLGLYPAYVESRDPFGILSLIRNDWGLSAKVDQQWGGLLMWVPVCLVYLGFMIAALARLYAAPDENAEDVLVLGRSDRAELVRSLSRTEEAGRGHIPIAGQEHQS